MNYIFNKESRKMLREAVNKKIKELKNTINPGSFYGCGNVPGEE